MFDSIDFKTFIFNRYENEICGDKPVCKETKSPVYVYDERVQGRIMFFCPA